ncbi:hypothetical protein V2O64_24525 (plasmid) [Verrucomicrobiaceae bacterium 227]
MDLEKENEILRAEILRQREQIDLLERRLDYVLRQLHTLLDDESKKPLLSDATSAPEEGNANDDERNRSAAKNTRTKLKTRIKGLKNLVVEEQIHVPLVAPAPVSVLVGGLPAASQLAHIRCRFHEHSEMAKAAVKKDPKQTAALKHSWQTLGLMSQLHRIESELRKSGARPRLRQAIRSCQGGRVGSAYKTTVPQKFS